MSDHPVLIPTDEGPVGGIVSEPGRERRAAMMLLPGHGRPARSGVNGFWTRLARTCADLGIVVLRTDYSREGETLPIGEGGSGQAWRHELDLRLLGQVLPWFRRRAGEGPLLLAGVCSGARLAADLAGRDPGSVAGLFMLVPYLPAPLETAPREADAVPEVDPVLVERLRASHAAPWILVGEHDNEDIATLQRLLGAAAGDLELEVAPGKALHFLDQPDIQAEARRRLLARVSRALTSYDSLPER